MKLNYPTELPIVTYREEFLSLLLEHQVIIVSGETGSGKTTQLPKFCLEQFPEGSALIGCTQPRRVAATSVSERVASELAPHQNLVGYRIRFHDKTSKETRIKFMTDGMLLAETRRDPLLRRYAVIIIDEAHERSLNIDFLLGYLKNLLPKRPDLKLIITSATIDTSIFARHFGDAPIMAVEGRSYPVEVRYQDDIPEKDVQDEISMVESCVEALLDLHRREIPQDTLIFLATEKEIRECCNLLEHKTSNCLILPMFGRLAAGDQKKIFKSSGLPKIVVATNVAETSITVPGIRYVIDSGEARISQYNVRARTTSLPISRISKASADQRKGRCGRIGPGICIRLFSEEDYLSREPYTLPEIKRSNLADVILQMISMNLGSPFDFPFVEPPPSGAIRDGYSLLKELGAIGENKELTKNGTIMARLPIDPPISRILIAARSNHCVREIKIIAPALAIQDPRVRPADKQHAADQAHKIFAHKHSDFNGLLAIWNLLHGHEEGSIKPDSRPSWGHLKKFCKTHYLSFQRMREWIDLHGQLSSLLDREKGFTENSKEASYAAIHKSLCSGFLRNIGLKKENEKKIYLGAGGKEFMVFPGSHQFHTSGKWLIGATFLETNRLYALTVANVEVEWLMEAASHLTKISWSNPRWQKKSGQVVADEKIVLFGFILSSDRTVNFGMSAKKNMAEARQIFIQQGLLPNDIHGNFPFLKRNSDMLKKWQATEERLRKRDLLVDDSSLQLFYEQRLPADVYDRLTLAAFLGRSKDTKLLVMSEEDVLQRRPEDHELQDFPKNLQLGSRKLKLSYHLEPGDNDDGVTVRIPLDDLDSFSDSTFEWLVPGLLREKVTFLLKGLPKRLRKHLIPINNTVDLLLDGCEHYQGSLYQALERGIFKMVRIKVGRSDWPDTLPPHLKMRYLLFDSNGRTVATGRELYRLSQTRPNSPQQQQDHSSKKTQALKIWEGKLFSTWDFEGLERRTPLFTSQKEMAGYLYPTLHVEKNRGGVTLSFESDKKEVIQLNRKGVLYLYQLSVKDQFKSLKKYCHTSLSGPSVQWLITKFGNRTVASDALLDFIMASLFHIEDGYIPDKKTFDAEIERIKQGGLFRMGQEICDEVFRVMRSRKELSDLIVRYTELARKSRSYITDLHGSYQSLLEDILQDDFLTSQTASKLTGCERYFKALSIRIERAHANPAKDRNKAAQIKPFENRLSQLPDHGSNLPPDCREAIALFHTMLAEFRIVVFAPEIKGGMQVSSKKLKTQWQELQAICPGI
jgi:ATP-dependent helicase HrpA